IRFQLPLTLNGEYRIRFTSLAEAGLPEEKYPEQTLYKIEVDPETEATFEYRPYLGWSKQTFRVPYLPELRAVRGTKVNLAYFRNRPLKGARLDMRFGEGARAVKKTLDGVVDPKKPDVVLFPWFVLDPVGGHSHGRYRIAYTTREGESTTDPQTYPIEVL